MSEIPNELSVILISRVDGNSLLQVNYPHKNDVALVWRKADSAMAWVKAGGIVTQADDQPGGHSYKVSFRLPDGTRQPIGEIHYFTIPTSQLRQMGLTVCLDPAPGSIKGTLVTL
jgi:hypothetical protein